MGYPSDDEFEAARTRRAPPGEPRTTTHDPDTVHRVRQQLRALQPAERMDVFRAFCTQCGQTSPGCCGCE